MNVEQGLLRGILLWLSHRHASWLREASGGPAELYNRIAPTWPPIYETELEGLIGRGKTFSTQNRYIFLEPRTEHGLIQPILSLDYDFKQGCPELRLRMALFSVHGNKLVALGLRFETPEGEGDHNYYHSQLIEGLSDAHPRLPCQEWLPVSYPSLVLNAVNALTLFVAMLISLYGLRFELDLRQAHFGSELTPYMKDMHWSGQGIAPAKRFQKDSKGRWRWESQ